MSDDQGWDTSTDSDPTFESTDSAPTDDDGTSSPSSDDQEQKGEPQLDLSQAQVGQPPDEALAFNDFETSWAEGVA